MMNRTAPLPIFVLICTSLVFVSCWKQQSHESQGPELPNYKVSGHVFHSVTNEPLPEATVTIDDQESLTDSSGFYSISDVLGGNDYIIIVAKDNFETYANPFQLGYSDLDFFDIALGKILYFTDRTRAPSYEPNSLVWAGNTPWSCDGLRKRIYALDETNGLSWIKYFDSPGSFPDKGHYTTPCGLTATQENGTDYLWISVEYEESPPRIYKMAVRNDTTLSTEGWYDTPESALFPGEKVLLDDLTYDGNSIWSCSSSEGKIYKHGPDMSVVGQFDSPEGAPSGITWDGQQLWLCEKGSNRLSMLNVETLELQGFYVIQETPVMGVCYRKGYIWVCKHGTEIDGLPSWFYKYRVK
ncbi:MAG: carboxypeptidase regulatory-like domain-containing protein [Gemmatimonadota bacterium]|nr:MAG: carboxypeptidase regulatory-like domain-containing protein [Gemmatimonadota bacterium]